MSILAGLVAIGAVIAFWPIVWRLVAGVAFLAVVGALAVAILGGAFIGIMAVI